MKEYILAFMVGLAYVFFIVMSIKACVIEEKTENVGELYA
jgi:hypothetical protein